MIALKRRKPGDRTNRSAWEISSSMCFVTRSGRERSCLRLIVLLRLTIAIEELSPKTAGWDSVLRVKLFGV